MAKPVVGTYKVMCGAQERDWITICNRCAKEWNGTVSHLERAGFAGHGAECTTCGAKNQ